MAAQLVVLRAAWLVGMMVELLVTKLVEWKEGMKAAKRVA